MEVNEKHGFSTTTYRLKLFQKHFDWIQLTKEKYNNVLEFYYRLLFKNREWLSLSNQNLLRKLEVVTIGEKKKGVCPSVPLPEEKVPLYFRRAAINGAISMVRSHNTREKEKHISPAKQFNASPVYYKGMYKEFGQDSILLKLWTGYSWCWVRFRFQGLGRQIPEYADCLSPSLKIEGNYAYLHVPVIKEVTDVRKAKERIEEKEKICSVYCPNGNHLAVCTIFDYDGSFIRTYFIKGGKEIKHRRKHYQRKMRKYIEMGNEKASLKEGEKIRNLTEDYAHKVSREIVNYCIRNQVKIIVAPHYRDQIPIESKGYLQAADYDWIGRRIIQYVDYKAFQSGIVLTKVNPHYMVSRCHVCQNKIKRYNEGFIPNNRYFGGKLFICPDHHTGNTAYNAARNIGQSFLDKYAQ